MPDAVKGMILKENEEAVKDCQVAFSAMPADQAKEVSRACRHGMAVFPMFITPHGPRCADPAA
jgi:predicted dinucleotide-binding enzyme